jgi:hypothetical protein
MPSMYLYNTMDIGARKWHILEQLALISDDRLLAQIEEFIGKKIIEEDLDPEVLDELDEQERQRLNGEVKMYSREEASKMIRDGFME